MDDRLAPIKSAERLRQPRSERDDAQESGREGVDDGDPVGGLGGEEEAVGGRGRDGRVEGEGGLAAMGRRLQSH